RAVGPRGNVALARQAAGAARPAGRHGDLRPRPRPVARAAARSHAGGLRRKLAAAPLRRLLLEVLLDCVPEEAEGFLLGAAGDGDGGVGDGGGAVEAFFLDEIDFDAHRRSAPGPAVCGSRHARTLTVATGSVKARALRRKCA